MSEFSGHLDLPAGRCAYRRWGAPGPGRLELVLLHGNAGSAASWTRVGPALADQFVVHAPDLRGHGGSSRPPAGRYRLRTVADDVVSFLDGLDIREPVVAGHSWGAAIALVLAAGAETQRPPPPVRGLVLEDLPPLLGPGFHPEELRKLRKSVTMPPDELRHLVASAHTDWAEADVDSLLDGFAKADPEIMRSVVHDAAHSGPLLPLLSRLSCPVLLMRADPRIGSALDDEAWAKAQSLLPIGSTALEFHDASHDIHRDQLAGFVEAITSFARACGGKPRPQDRSRPSTG